MPKRQPSKSEREKMLEQALKVAQEMRLFDRPADVAQDDGIRMSDDEDELRRLGLPTRASWFFKNE